MNLNKVARDVTKLEKGKAEVNIAQTKEIMKCLLQVFARYGDDEILDKVKKYR